jgi:hypothetical protein
MKSHKNINKRNLQKKKQQKKKMGIKFDRKKPEDNKILKIK